MVTSAKAPFADHVPASGTEPSWGRCGAQHVIGCEVGVGLLGGADAGMPEDLLELHEITRALGKVGREAMAQRVERHPLCWVRRRQPRPLGGVPESRVDVTHPTPHQPRGLQAAGI